MNSSFWSLNMRNMILAHDSWYRFISIVGSAAHLVWYSRFTNISQFVSMANYMVSLLITVTQALFAHTFLFIYLQYTLDLRYQLNRAHILFLWKLAQIQSYQNLWENTRNKITLLTIQHKSVLATCRQPKQVTCLQKPRFSPGWHIETGWLGCPNKIEIHKNTKK